MPLSGPNRRQLQADPWLAPGDSQVCRAPGKPSINRRYPKKKGKPWQTPSSASWANSARLRGIPNNGPETAALIAQKAQTADYSAGVRMERAGKTPHHTPRRTRPGCVRGCRTRRAHHPRRCRYARLQPAVQQEGCPGDPAALRLCVDPLQNVVWNPHLDHRGGHCGHSIVCGPSEVILNISTP